jgi:hypothetical protein
MRAKIIYTARFECEVEWERDEDEVAAICDIDIPEGGGSNSFYCEDSFKVEKVIRLPDNYGVEVPV